MVVDKFNCKVYLVSLVMLPYEADVHVSNAFLDEARHSTDISLYHICTPVIHDLHFLLRSF